MYFKILIIFTVLVIKMNLHGLGTSFGTEADNYVAGRPPFPDELFADMKGFIGSQAEILDIACGTGRLTIPLYEKMSRHVTGFDIDPQMLQAAKEIAARKGDEIPFIQGEVKNLAKQFPEGHFEVITVASAIHWLLTPEDLNAIRQVLNPQGTLLVIGGNGVGHGRKAREISKARENRWNLHQIVRNVAKDILGKELVEKPELPVKEELEKHQFRVEERAIFYKETFTLDQALAAAKSYSSYTSLTDLEKEKIKDPLDQAVQREFLKLSQDGIVTKERNLRYLVCHPK